MKTGSITYNGKNSLTDLGIYVTGSGSFDAAELDVDRYEVAGRNGDIIIPKNRYKNIPISYPAFIPKGFDGKVQSVRNWLRSAKTYARLEDTYDVNHFRLGLANGVQSFEPVNRNDASNFQLSFDCRPERFLKTGETPLTVEPEAHSYSGEIVEFETVAVDDMTKAEVSLSPIQSLNGYDHPWAGGAGKNLLETAPFADYTSNGVSLHRNSDGSILLNETSTGRVYRYINVAYTLKLDAGVYTVSSSGLTDGVFVNIAYSNTQGGAYAGTFGTIGGTTPSRTITVTGTVYIGALLDQPSGTPNNNRLVKVQVEKGETTTAWTPYENLCPITGHDSATLYRAGENLLPNKKHQSTTNAVALGQDRAYGTYQDIYLKAGTYTLNVASTVSGISLFYNSQKTGEQTRITTGEETGTFTLADNDSLSFWAYKSGGLSIDAITSFQLELGNQPSADEPYAGTSYPVTFPQTVYGGTFDWVSGKLKVTMANIASYNGETIGEPWLSSMDAYVAGATPTTGAQVVHTIAPTETTLTPAQVQTLLGLNNVWASDGSVEIAYADPFNVDNPTYFEASPLFEITNPAQNDVLNVNGKTITFLSGYTGTVTIDCETMDAYSSSGTNLNYLISATDFPVLNEGVNIVTWSGSGSCKMTPRWWEL